MNMQSEITVDMQLSDIVEAIFEYLYHHGIDGRGCPCEFIMTRKNDEGVNLVCRITGAKERNA